MQQVASPEESTSSGAESCERTQLLTGGGGYFGKSHEEKPSIGCKKRNSKELLRRVRSSLSSWSLAYGNVAINSNLRCHHGGAASSVQVQANFEALHKPRHHSYTADCEGDNTCECAPPMVNTGEQIDNDHRSLGANCASQQRQTSVEIETAAAKYGSTDFFTSCKSIDSQFCPEAHKAVHLTASHCSEQPIQISNRCWRAGVWSGVVLMAIGLLLVLVGFCIPRQTAASSGNLQSLLRQNQQADQFNDRLELCKLSGVTLFCLGGMCAVVCLFLPRLLFGGLDDDSFSVSCESVQVAGFANDSHFSLASVFRVAQAPK